MNGALPRRHSGRGWAGASGMIHPMRAGARGSRRGAGAPTRWLAVNAMSGDFSVSDDGLTITKIPATAWSTIFANNPKRKGKWYFEVDTAAAAQTMFGVLVDAGPLTTFIGNSHGLGIGYYSGDVWYNGTNVQTATGTPYHAAFEAGWTGVAVDLDAQTLKARTFTYGFGADIAFSSNMTRGALIRPAVSFNSNYVLPTRMESGFAYSPPAGYLPWGA